MIVTVSRQIGAGGGEVARRAAEALGFRLVDNELIDRVAARAGVSKEEVADHEERAPGFIERLARALARSAPELQSPAPDRPPESGEAALVRVTERVVEELAAEGRIVLVGRAAPAVLRGEYGALHVKIVAPAPARLARIRERFGLDAREAEHRLRDTDASRARYHRHYYERDWDDASLYHMVLNSEALGLEAATALVVAQARRMWAL
jgi:cytidylate kinase